MKLNNFQATLLILLLSVVVFSCKKQDITKQDTIKIEEIFSIDYAGQINKIEILGYYSVADAANFLQIANLNGRTEATTGFFMYRMTYKSKNFDNTDIWVSGLMAVPDNKNIKGVVSYQHGTNPDRNNVPSKPSLEEGIPISSVFAGNGYILLAPDYIGLGVSKEIPTYLHTTSTVNNIIDFIKIGSKTINYLTNGQNKNLYLAGFSQGGNATAGVHRALEANLGINNNTNLILKASACVAGAYNLRNISAKYAINNESMLYLAYLANSYAKVYNQPLGSIIKDEYVNLLPSLFDGSKSVDFILRALPNTPNQLLRQNIIDEVLNRTNTNSWFGAALAENETYLWKPIAKTRLFYGTLDTDVSPEDAISAYNYMKSIGGNAQLVNIGNFNHVNTLLNSLPEIQKWFNEI